MHAAKGTEITTDHCNHTIECISVSLDNFDQRVGLAHINQQSVALYLDAGKFVSSGTIEENV